MITKNNVAGVIKRQEKIIPVDDRNPSLEAAILYRDALREAVVELEQYKNTLVNIGLRHSGNILDKQIKEIKTMLGE